MERRICSSSGARFLNRWSDSNATMDGLYGKNRRRKAKRFAVRRQIPSVNDNCVDKKLRKRHIVSYSGSSTFLQRGSPPPPPWGLLPGFSKRKSSKANLAAPEKIF